MITTQAWILYIDIYGFSDQVGKEGEKICFSRLNEAVKKIRTDVLEADFYPLILSDSIFLIAPTDARKNRELFLKFYELSRDIQDELIDHQFLPRGGIAFGQVCISDRTIVGKPVIEAVRLEQHISIPCVFLPAREKQPYEINSHLLMPTKTQGLVQGLVVLPRTIRSYRALIKKRLTDALMYGPDKAASALAQLDNYMNDKWSSNSHA